MSDESATATLDAPTTSASTAGDTATAGESTPAQGTGAIGASPSEAKWLTENLGTQTPATTAAAKPPKPSVKPQQQRPAAAPIQQASDDAFEDDPLTDPSDELDPPAGEQLDEEDGTATPSALSPDQVKLLSRFKMSQEAFGMLPAQQRTELLASFENHARYTSQIARENAAFKRGAPPQQQQQAPTQQQPAQPAGDDAWKPLATEYGDEYVKPFQGAVRAEIAPVQKNLNDHQQALLDVMQRFVNDDIDAAFDKLELPDGVDKSDEQVRQAILNAAWQQVRGMEGGLSFSKRSLRTAIEQAATSLYHQKITQAAADAKAQQKQQRLRGSPNRSPSRAPTTRAPITQEQRERLYLAGQDKGLSGDALQTFIRNGGQ